MLIEQPPLLYRLLFPEAFWRIKLPSSRPVVYLTFDDGPVPEVTPRVLDLLDELGVRATFFMVGDNVRRYVRDGSIIVFHDSLKARDNMLEAMPRAVRWLLDQGYEFHVLGK